MYTQRVKRCHKPSFEKNSTDQKTVYSRSMYGIAEYNQLMMAKILRERKRTLKALQTN